MKKVAHIRQISVALRQRFGDRRRVGDHVVHTFPPARRIARGNEDDLRKCALGYRAKNLLASARLVDSANSVLRHGELCGQRRERGAGGRPPPPGVGGGVVEGGGGPPPPRGAATSS